MFGKKIPLFNLFGFKVQIDVSWFILAILITWSLAKGVFPHFFEGFSNVTYWWMGAAGAVGLFVSIVFHEFCHSIVARQYGLPMKGITLFIFGGVAEMETEPESPKVEFLMAAAGPVSSMLLAGILFVTYYVTKTVFAKPASSVIVYLAGLNLLLAAFNLIPAFPLDGGRILRSILWGVKHNLQWATRVASMLGNGFGIFLIVMGIFSFIRGNFVGGLWWFLIGMFIKSASQISYRQVVVRHVLAGEHVRRFMRDDPVTVSPAIAISELVEDYFYKYHYKMFPVVQGDRLIGCITSRHIKQLSRDEWEQTSTQRLTEQCTDENTVSPDTEAIDALALMNRTGNSRLLVVDGDRLVGIVTLKDLLKFLAMKIDLEGEK
ncbi:MAG: site-2 protease family protein [Phycisphaerae bacterium]|nr:site-2 protease family protein [Phycisphaerae bacterium]